MNIRNAQSKNTANTLIDVEIEHPSLGWIPYTFNTETTDESLDAEVREYLLTNNPASYVEPVITLQQAKDTKITQIDSQTATDIELIVGDAVQQRNMLAEYLYALDAGEDVSAYKAKWEQVAQLRATGNAKEAQVQACTTIAEVEAI